MGNCCVTPKKTKKIKKTKENPFSIHNPNFNHPNPNPTVLAAPTDRHFHHRYSLSHELGRDEFGVTYLTANTEDSSLLFACKSISKSKLRTSIDVDDVRREVDIMRSLPPNPNILTLKDTFEDDEAVHFVMELCESGELFDRIVQRGHYTERASTMVTKTIVEVVQMCHMHGVMHRALKPEIFWRYEDKKK